MAGKVLGKSALGAYTFAWTLAGAPAEKVTGMVIRVTPSIFAAVQSDLAALRRYLLKLAEGLALLTFPAAFGLALVADKLVLLALGKKWSAMIIPLQLLAFYTSVRSVSPLLHQILAVTGENRFAMWSNVAAAIALPPAFYNRQPVGNGRHSCHVAGGTPTGSSCRHTGAFSVVSSWRPQPISEHSGPR